MNRGSSKRRTETIVVEEEKNENNENNEDDGDLRKYDLTNMPEYIKAEIDAFMADFPEVGEKYVLTDRVGEGAFSTVYKGYLRNNPDYFIAMKRIYFTSRPSRVENEIKFLLDLGGRHNIVKMVDGIRKKDQIVLVLEHFEHTNFKQFMKGVTVRQLQLYLRSLFESLAYIHMKGVIHHDVKPSNFLYNKDHCKGVLVDFGLAQSANKYPNTRRDEVNRPIAHSLPGFQSFSQLHKITPLSGEQDFRLSQKTVVDDKAIYINPNDRRPILRASRAGTRGFRAPEILWKDTNQTIAVDVWSAGVILLTLLTGRYPFFQSSDDMTGLAELSCVFGQKEMIKAAQEASGIKLTFRGIPEGEDFSKDWRSFCRRLNPVLNDKMPDSVYELLDKCLELNPKERITAKDAYLHEFLQSLYPE